MKKLSVETAVGAFLIAGFASFAYLAVRLGDLPFFPSDTYTITAAFTNVSGLKKGADVVLAGVTVGKVTEITLDQKNYEAVVSMAIHNGIRLQDDAIASIKTAGIIGDKYVGLKPGASETILTDGGYIFDTESSIDIEELVSKYIFEKK